MISISNVHGSLKLLPFVILGLLIYSNTTSVPFYLDDLPNIAQHPHIRLTKLDLRHITDVGLRKYASRPVAHMSFALNYYFNKNNVAGYHIVNIVIHILTGIFFYFFLRLTLSISSVRSRHEPYESIALFAALVWLVHPVHTQSVTYVVQRMNSMAAMFYVMSFFFYVKGRLAKGNQKGWLWFSACAVAGILAVGSKEIAVTLPFLVLLYEWYFFQDFSTAWLKRRLPYVIGALIIFGVLVFLYLGRNPLEVVLSGYRHWDFTLKERVLTEFRVVIFYMSLLVFPSPSRLSLDHDFALSHTLIDPTTTLLSMVAIVGLIGLAICVTRKDPLISFGCLWFFANLVIESSIIALDLVFEHRTYLPSMFFILIVVVLAYRYIQEKRVVVGVLSAVIFLFCLWTYERNGVWKDPVTFWRDSADQSGNKGRSLINLGLALAREGKLDEAIFYYTEALQMDPDNAPAHNNLGVALARKGKFDDAIFHYSEALRIRPRYPEARINLGNALAGQDKLDEAIAQYSKALGYEEAHYNLGLALARQGNLGQAIIHYSKALQMSPDYAEAHYHLGLALARQGKLDQAIVHYSKALQMRPDYAKAHNSLGLALAGQGKLDAAIGHFSKSIRIRRDYAEAHYNLGVASAQKGRVAKAVGHYAEALRINPNYAEAHNNLGIILAQEGKLDEAVTHFSEALRIRPDWEAAHSNLSRALQKAGRSVETSNLPSTP
jgi:tetratricopeptide (TPR) repeat protein